MRERAEAREKSQRSRTDLSSGEENIKFFFRRAENLLPLSGIYGLDANGTLQEERWVFASKEKYTAYEFERELVKPQRFNKSRCATIENISILPVTEYHSGEGDRHETHKKCENLVCGIE